MKYLLIVSTCLMAALSQTTYTRYTQQCEFQQTGTTTQTTLYAFWNKQWCVPCQNYCTCSEYGACSSVTCPEGTVETTGKVCTACPTGCTTCSKDDGTNNYECSSCATNYQKIGSQCIMLGIYPINVAAIQQPYTVYQPGYTQVTNGSVNCEQYDPSTSFCQTCPQGSFLNEYNSCEQCQSGCSTCTARGTCSTCSVGYYWNSSQNAQSSLSAATDNGQLNGYYSYGAGACVLCSGQNVATCNATTVLTCVSGYYLSNGSCLQCSTGCVTCTGPTACTQCTVGYYVNSGGCILCSGNTTTISCSVCTSGQSTSCDTCVTGYINLSGVCIMCSESISGCAICSAGTQAVITCTTCMNGYYPMTDNGVTTCVQCPANVLYCDYSNNIVVPTQCIAGYLLAPVSSGATVSTCVANPNNCLTMVDSGQLCATCWTNYFLVNQKCVSCFTTYLGCTACSVSGSSPSQILECTACTSGNVNGAGNYALNTSSHSCTACPVGCSTCSATGSCSQCIPGYSLNGNNCTACTIVNCSTCSTTGTTQTCQTCLDGYFVYTANSVTTCNACPWGCSQCGSNGQQCTSCQTGFYLNNNGCNYGVRYCAKQNSDGSCDDCMYGFRKINGICAPCIDFSSGFVCGHDTFKSNALMVCSIVVALLLAF